MEKYHVEDATAKEKLNEIGGKIGQALEGTGFFFTLLLTDNGRTDRKGAIFYISSAERAGMVKTMHEFIENDQRGADHHCRECGCPAYAWQRNENGEGYKTA
jgi:hypothetical protein